MKKIIFLLLFIPCWLISQAQIALNLQFPLSGVMTKNQLWNLSIVNSSNETYNVSVEMIMSDVSNSQRVMKGISKYFSVPKGVKQVQAMDVNPIVYSSGNPGYNVTSDPNAFLPIGVFNVCYTITRIDGDAVERLAEECETVEINPISPPQLILPADSDQIETNRPLFTWLPPSPVSSFNSLLYDLTLVEILPGQASSDAVQRNVPLLIQRNLRTASFQYPSSMRGLDTSRYYAWEITAKTSMNAISDSEVWAFSLKKDIHTARAGGALGYYAKLNIEENSGLASAKGILRYEYVNDINDQQILLHLFDINSGKRKPVALDSAFQIVHLGQNLIDLSLENNSAMIDKHIYLLELLNSRNEKRYLKFKYSIPE